MARESIESWRALAPDLRMELSQEIREKHRIAIGFRITGTHTGDTPELISTAQLPFTLGLPPACKPLGLRDPGGRSRSRLVISKLAVGLLEHP
jgi:hypothetical protein